VSTSVKPRPARRAESTLLRPTLLGLMRLGWVNQMSLADTEIGWHQKHIDLAFQSKQSVAGPVAIELKVNSTSRAIVQASLNRYLTPSSWVATWTPPTSKVLARARKEGVGVLLVVEGGVYPVLYPRRGEPHTDALVEHLEGHKRRVRDLLSFLRHG
jgi:hypothetical protein